MRQANAVLEAYLASRAPCFSADLFTITLSNGNVYTWTSFDKDLLIPPYTYSSLGPVIDRTKWSIKNTIDVPEMEIRIFSTGSDLPDGSNLKLLVHNGLFDYSTVLLSRVFMPPNPDGTPGPTSLGVVELFKGYTSQLQIDSLGITLTVKGANLQLAQYMPRNQYMTSCIHSVYDIGCAPDPGQPGGGPSRAANTFTSYCGPASTRTFIAWGGGVAPPTPHQFGGGYIVFTSGTSGGITRTINFGNSNIHGVQLAYPLYQTPEPGDTYTVTYGCNRTRGSGGCAFFNNLQHYRGFPYIPSAEFGV